MDERDFSRSRARHSDTPITVIRFSGSFLLQRKERWTSVVCLLKNNLFIFCLYFIYKRKTHSIILQAFLQKVLHFHDKKNFQFLFIQLQICSRMCLLNIVTGGFPAIVWPSHDIPRYHVVSSIRGGKTCLNSLSHSGADAEKLKVNFRQTSCGAPMPWKSWLEKPSDS